MGQLPETFLTPFPVSVSKAWKAAGRSSTTLKAKILRVCCCDLLVCDVCTCQEILVHMPRACCFSVGECVCIEYSGAMTMSIPPQITATDIRRVCGCC